MMLCIAVMLQEIITKIILDNNNVTFGDKSYPELFKKTTYISIFKLLARLNIILLSPGIWDILYLNNQTFLYNSTEDNSIHYRPLQGSTIISVITVPTGLPF